MIDIIAAGDMERLWGTLWLWLGFAAVVLPSSSGLPFPSPKLNKCPSVCIIHRDM